MVGSALMTKRSTPVTVNRSNLASTVGLTVTLNSGGALSTIGKDAPSPPVIDVSHLKGPSLPVAAASAFWPGRTAAALAGTGLGVKSKVLPVRLTS